ncbi:hypothetical protein U1Q18_051435 [Sarracenia purpurea var. burkii]
MPMKCPCNACLTEAAEKLGVKLGDLDRQKLKEAILRSEYNQSQIDLYGIKYPVGGLGILQGSAALLNGKHLQQCVIGPLTNEQRKCVIDKRFFDAMEIQLKGDEAPSHRLPWKGDEEEDAVKAGKAPDAAAGSSDNLATNPEGKEIGPGSFAFSSTQNEHDDPSIDEIDYNARFLEMFYDVPKNKWNVSRFTHHVRNLNLANCKISSRGLRVMSVMCNTMRQPARSRAHALSAFLDNLSAPCLHLLYMEGMFDISHRGAAASANTVKITACASVNSHASSRATQSLDANKGVLAAAIFARFIRRSIPSKARHSARTESCGRGIEGKLIVDKVGNSFKGEIDEKPAMHPQEIRTANQAKGTPSSNLTIVEIQISECMCAHTDSGEVPLKVFQDIFMDRPWSKSDWSGQTEGKGKQKDGVAASSGLAKTSADTTAPKRRRWEAQTPLPKPDRRHRTAQSVEGDALWLLVSQMSNRQFINLMNCRVWKMAFKVLAGARVLSCNVQPGKKKGGKSPWSNCLQRFVGMCSNTLTTDLRRKKSSTSMTSLLKNSSPPSSPLRATGVPSDMERPTKASLREASRPSALGLVLRSQIETQLRSPCREDLSASARAFLAVTDTTNSRSALDLDTVISELRHCKDLQAMIDCDVHTRRGHGWLIPHPPPSLDDAGGRKAAMKLLAAMLAAKTDSSGGLTTMTLGDNLFDGLGSWM